MPADVVQAPPAGLGHARGGVGGAQQAGAREGVEDGVRAEPRRRARVQQHAARAAQEREAHAHARHASSHLKKKKN